MKCAITECKNTFAAIIESHLPREVLPHLVCNECWQEMELSVNEQNQSLAAGKRCH